MSQSDRFDEFNNENEGQNNTSDTYTAESSADIYNTPDVSDGIQGDTPVEDAPVEDVVVESVPVEDGSIEDVVVESTPVEEIIETDAVVPYGNPYNNPNNPYGNSPYNNPNNPYDNSPYNNPNNPYGNSPYNNLNNSYGNSPYNNNQYGYNPYGGQMPQNGNQGSNPYNNNPYNNNQYNNANNQYNNNPYGNGPSGNPPYNNNQFSPYAVPPKKKSTGLIIGIVVAVAVLFLIAFCALIYRAVSLYNEDSGRARDNRRDDYRFDDDDDDWGVTRNNRERDRDDDDYDYDDYDEDDYDYDYDYDDWYDDYDYDYDYDYDDSEYYDFHDDVKYNLSYSVDFDYYEYETDNEYVYISVNYPIIEGDDVPNLDKLNDAIWAEVEYFADYYEDEYADYMTDDDDYFLAYADGYVTYMDEEKMSVVFREEIISSYYDYAYVYCINIDMEHGVILDNENMLSIDDDFSADFRARSEVQNPNSKTYLSYMSDQEMTKSFNSSDIIVFYTPMGMEIGFNYDTHYSHGWVTVTYKEYEQYLKVF